MAASLPDQTSDIGWSMCVEHLLHDAIGPVGSKLEAVVEHRRNYAVSGTGAYMESPARATQDQGDSGRSLLETRLD